MFAYLLITYFDRNVPLLNEFLEFLGIIERTEEPGDATNPSKPPFTRITLHLSRIIDLLPSPLDLARTLYEWGAPTFDGVLLLEALHKLFINLGIPVIFDAGAVSPKLDFIFLELSPKTDISPPGLLFVSKSDESIESLFTIEQNEWKIDFGVEFETPIDTQLIFQPDGSITLVSRAC